MKFSLDDTFDCLLSLSIFVLLGFQYFRKLNTAISVVYVETWHQYNHLSVDRTDDLRATLVKLTDYYGKKKEELLDINVNQISINPIQTTQ
jgi:hypothetical protein